jgi:hypothetical protein
VLATSHSTQILAEIVSQLSYADLDHVAILSKRRHTPQVSGRTLRNVPARKTWSGPAGHPSRRRVVVTLCSRFIGCGDIALDVLAEPRAEVTP